MMYKQAVIIELVVGFARWPYSTERPVDFLEISIKFVSIVEKAGFMFWRKMMSAVKEPHQ